jgi:hypothetical protein
MLRPYPGLPLGAAPTSPAALSGAGTIWLARTGGLPGRSLAGYRRWALTPPFHPSPVPDGVTPLRPSAGLLSVALDVAAGLRRAAPRVLGPSGLSGRESSALASPDFALRTGLRGHNHSDGSDGPDLPRYYTPGVRRRARRLALPRRISTILVGVRRSSTLSAPLQRFCQRGSSLTEGSNQMPEPSVSTAPS